MSALTRRHTPNRGPVGVLFSSWSLRKLPLQRQEEYVLGYHQHATGLRPARPELCIRPFPPQHPFRGQPKQERAIPGKWRSLRSPFCEDGDGQHDVKIASKWGTVDPWKPLARVADSLRSIA